MTNCPKRTYKWLGVFPKKDKHLFIVSNAFYTLENSFTVDVIKTCQLCGAKEVLSMDRDTLLDVVKLYPNAFNETLRNYLLTWDI